MTILPLTGNKGFNLHNKPSAREKLKDSGYAALMGGDIDADNPPRMSMILLGLSDNGWKALFDGIIIEVLEQQRQNWINAKRTGNDFPGETDLLAEPGIREVYFELLNLRKLIKPIGGVNKFIAMNPDGTYSLPVPNIEFLTIKEIIDLEIAASPDLAHIIHTYDYNWSAEPLWDGTIEGAKHNPKNPNDTGYNPNWPYILNDQNDTVNDLWEIQYLPDLPAKGDQGEKGDQGDQGIPGQDGQPGATGPQGATGICDCDNQITGGGGTDPGTIKPVPPGSGGGSGTGGATNPDGKDISVSLANCIPIDALSHGPLGNGVEYQNVDITDAIKTTTQSSGRFDPLAEDLVSVRCRQEAVCYTGTLASIIGLPFDIPLASDARHATYTDTKSNSKYGLHFVDTTATGQITVDPPENTSGVPSVGTSVQAGGRVYQNDFVIDMQGSFPVKYDGQFPQLPSWLTWLFTQTLKTGPKTSAYHHFEICGFVKRKKVAACPQLPMTTYFGSSYTAEQKAHSISGQVSEDRSTYILVVEYNSWFGINQWSPPAGGNINGHLKLSFYGFPFGPPASMKIALYSVDSNGNVPPGGDRGYMIVPPPPLDFGPWSYTFNYDQTISISECYRIEVSWSGNFRGAVGWVKVEWV